MRPIVAVALALGACADPGESSPPPEPSVFDATIDWTSDHSNTIRFDGPVYEIPPLTDQTNCYFDTYTGEDTAVKWAGFYQNLDYGHHVVLMASEADEDEWPDGTIADCTSANADIMVDARPFLFASDLEGELQPEMTLPDGMAVDLDAGTRFVIQSHYINTREEPIRVNDTVFLELVEPASVETWAAPWVHTETDFVVPAGQDLTVQVDCTFDMDVTLLSLLGHLHEWGASYSVDHHRSDSTVERVYDVPSWDAQYRDAPPINLYELGEFQVAAGERFVTSCSWHNDEDYDLTFPFEMCATVGFAYPLTATIICEGAL